LRQEGFQVLRAFREDERILLHRHFSAVLEERFGVTPIRPDHPRHGLDQAVLLGESLVVYQSLGQAVAGPDERVASG